MEGGVVGALWARKADGALGARDGYEVREAGKGEAGYDWLRVYGDGRRKRVECKSSRLRCGALRRCVGAARCIGTLRMRAGGFISKTWTPPSTTRWCWRYLHPRVWPCSKLPQRPEGVSLTDGL